MNLPILASKQTVHERLQQIFPDGVPVERKYVTRDQAASTVYVMLYIGAIEGGEIDLQPKHVYRMTEEHSHITDDATRRKYANDVRRPKFYVPGNRWYEDTTREPIRDETLKEGLVALGAVILRGDVATTSNKARYVLSKAFSDLFDPALSGEALAIAITAWQAKNLSKGALARIAINRAGAGASGSDVLVTYPNGDTRKLKPGPSSIITKAVIEVFATTFLKQPGVIFVSESAKKEHPRDSALAKAIGLNIKADKNLPDTILVDLAPEHPLLIFVEAVATDGPINEGRKKALEKLAIGAGFPLEHIAFVTAYLDRGKAPFKKTVASLAWGSYAWFVAEPDALITLSSNRNSL